MSRRAGRGHHQAIVDEAAGWRMDGGARRAVPGAELSRRVDISRLRSEVVVQVDLAPASAQRLPITA